VAGPGPVRWWDQAPASARGDPMYTTDPGTQDGVSIWHRRPAVHEGPVERRRRTWTHSSTEGRSKGAHAVEFSKTVAPLRKGASLPGALPRSSPIPERIGEYSAQRAARTIRARPRIMATAQPRTVASCSSTG
jgi:hypothetical protein